MSKTPTKPGYYYGFIGGKQVVVRVDENMMCWHDNIGFGVDNRRHVLWLGEAVPTLDELRQLRANQMPEGWVINEAHNERFFATMNNDGLYIVHDYPSFIGENGALTKDPKQAKEFGNFHEAAKAAEKAGEK